MSEASAPTDLLTKQQLCDQHPCIKMATLNKWLQHRESNGLAQYVRKLGRRILISESGFFGWLWNRES